MAICQELIGHNVMKEQPETTSQSETLADEGRQIVIRANYELFVIMLSVIQVFNGLLILLIRDSEIQRIPNYVSSGIALFLLLDAFQRLYRAQDRRHFLFTFHGYLLFIGSLPNPLHLFTIARLLWYWIMTRKLQRTDYIDMERVVVRRRAQSTMLGIIVAAIIVLQAGSLLILRTESLSSQANIQTANDAIWWALVTMATVGYGDMYPITLQGRLVALFVMVGGVGLFSVLTSFLAHSFLNSGPAEDNLTYLQQLQQPKTVYTSLDSIRALLDAQEDAQQTALAELRARLNELEAQVDAATGKSRQKS